jgi:hypothetical protein
MSQLFRIYSQRTFLATVPYRGLDDQGNDVQASFEVLYKVLPHDIAKKPEHKEKRLLDLVVVEVRKLELVVTADDGSERVLTGKELVQGCINDPGLSAAMLATYNEEVAKKNLART